MNRKMKKIAIPLGAALLAALMFSAGWWLGGLPAEHRVIASVSPPQAQAGEEAMAEPLLHPEGCDAGQR